MNMTQYFLKDDSLFLQVCSKNKNYHPSPVYKNEDLIKKKTVSFKDGTPKKVH
jgi:hypothetical protein